MRIRLHTLVLAVLLAGLRLPAGETQPLTLAVFDFESREEALRDAGTQAAALINAALSAEPDLITVERAELRKIPTDCGCKYVDEKSEAKPARHGFEVERCCGNK